LSQTQAFLNVIASASEAIQGRDIRCCGRYASEAENAGNDRDQEEQQRPSQNCHRPLLKPFDPSGRVSCEIADLTFEQGE